MQRRVSNDRCSKGIVHSSVLYIPNLITLLSTVPVCTLAQEVPGTESAVPLGTESAVLLSRTACCADTAWQEAEIAIAEELRLLNIPVKVVSGHAETSADLPDALFDEARNTNANVIISVLRTSETPARIEVWIYDRITDKTLVKRWRVADPNNADAAMVAGIRGVEALRASLLEIRLHPVVKSPLQKDKKPLSDLAANAKLYGVKDEGSHSTQQGAALVSDEIKRVAVGAGPSLLASFQGVSPRGGFTVVFDWQPLRLASLHFDAAYWPFGKDIENESGATSLKMLVLRGGLTWVIFDKGVVRPSVSILGGGFMSVARGLKGSEGRTPTSDITKVGYIGGSADAAFRISRWFFLRLGIGAGITLPEILLYHGDVKAASLGRPLLDAALRAECRLP